MRAHVVLVLTAALLTTPAGARELPPGASPRDAAGNLVGPVLVEAFRKDWLDRASALAHARDGRQAAIVDGAIAAAREIDAHASSRAAFLAALGDAPRVVLGTRAPAGPDGVAIELVDPAAPTLVRALVEPPTGRALVVALMPLPPLPWSLKIVAGQSIEGDTHRFAVDPAGRLRYERVSPRTWKVVAERDHLLRPDERTRLSALVDHERIAALTSQDFTREPLHLDQPHYTLDLAAARATHVELGMGPGAIGAHATDRERRVDRLLLLLASIAGVELR